MRVVTGKDTKGLQDSRQPGVLGLVLDRDQPAGGYAVDNRDLCPGELGFRGLDGEDFLIVGAGDHPQLVIGHVDESTAQRDATEADLCSGAELDGSG